MGRVVRRMSLRLVRGGFGLCREVSCCSCPSLLLCFDRVLYAPGPAFWTDAWALFWTPKAVSDVRQHTHRLRWETSEKARAVCARMRATCHILEQTDSPQRRTTAASYACKRGVSGTSLHCIASVTHACGSRVSGSGWSCSICPKTGPGTCFACFCTRDFLGRWAD